MAVIAKTDSKLRTHGDNVMVCSWSPLTQTGSDTGTPFECPGASDRSVQLTGTLGTGGVVVMEGSNVAVPGANDWGALRDMQGNAISLDSIGKLNQIGEITRWIRPRVSAGDAGTSLTVTLIAKRS